MHVKRFLEWIGVKEKLHLKVHLPPRVYEGEIWWAGLGENIGKEINGKSHDFTRPVIIFKKLSRDFYLVIPTTTQIRSGTWYVAFSLKGQLEVACLHQIRSLDFKRLHSKLGELDDRDFKKVQAGFLSLCSSKMSPAISDGVEGKSQK